MDAENPNGEHKLRMMYTGVVLNDVDPEKMSRVRVRIPGLTQDSGWAWPMGSPGGGGPRRGLKMTPRVGAEVNIFFRLGDPNQPYYMPGNWGRTDNGLETPGGGNAPPIGTDLNLEGDEVSAEEFRWIDYFETESFLFAIDERAHFNEGSEGKGSFFIRHKKSGNTIEYDGASNALLVNVELMTLDVSGLLDIRGGQVQINGRIVRSSAVDPI